MKILIVDDEAMQRELMQGFLEKQGYDVTIAASGPDALALFATSPFHLVLLDHKMPAMTGDEVLGRMKSMNPHVRSIMITAYGTVDVAVAVMKLGADDFLEKPVDLKSLLEQVRRIEQAIQVDEEVAGVMESLTDMPLPIRIIGDSPAMKELLSLVRRMARTAWTVLIKGETGTGKELIARLIHGLSERCDQPFIEVNCAAIPEDLFESELFGHEKGAFTGAGNRRKGRFELAEHGTLFLDEVGELPMPLQAKLLRALQENKICRVGGESPLAVDVRVLAATNRDPRQMVSAGLFRQDLFYRLNVLEVEIPPLRNRREDIIALTDFFLKRYALSDIRFAPDALDALIKYDFPGNVRELEHMIQRMVTLARGPVLQVADLPPDVRFHQPPDTGVLQERLAQVERAMLVSALEKYEGVQTQAARSLGISERVLRYKLRKYQIK